MDEIFLTSLKLKSKLDNKYVIKKITLDIESHVEFSALFEFVLLSLINFPSNITVKLN